MLVNPSAHSPRRLRRENKKEVKAYDEGASDVISGRTIGSRIFPLSKPLAPVNSLARRGMELMSSMPDLRHIHPR